MSDATTRWASVAEGGWIEPEALGLTDHHRVGHGEPDGVRDSVPVDGERPELNRDRARGEIDHRRGSLDCRSMFSRRLAT
jgi:hypothetical protein